MKILLDTVALYRAAAMPETLSEALRTQLEERSNGLYVSLISAWELSIKASLGKLPLPCPIDEFFQQATHDLIAEPIELDLAAIARVSQLRWHHRDPFDRLIISQAQIGGYTVATSDHHFSDYGVEVIW